MNKWHDAIDYVQRRDGVDFLGAMERLAGENIPQQRERPQAEPTIDREAWEATARRFAVHCGDTLWSGAASKALNYLHKRGLTDEALFTWGIGFNDTEGEGNPEVWGCGDVFLPQGITIPCYAGGRLHYIKIRRSSGASKYIMVKGSHPFLYGGDTFREASIAFLFESELDVILAWQSGITLGYASMPAGQRLQKEYAPFFAGIDDLIVAYDEDAPGQKAADELCALSPHFHKAKSLPSGKDLTDYLQSTGNRDDVTFWLFSQLDAIGGSHGA